jgi:hypothetical protein
MTTSGPDPELVQYIPHLHTRSLEGTNYILT